MGMANGGMVMRARRRASRRGVGVDAYTPFNDAARAPDSLKYLQLEALRRRRSSSEGNGNTAAARAASACSSRSSNELAPLAVMGSSAVVKKPASSSRGPRRRGDDAGRARALSASARISAARIVARGVAPMVIFYVILSAGGEGSEKRAHSAAGRKFPGVSVCVPALGSPRRYSIVQIRVASLSLNSQA